MKITRKTDVLVKVSDIKIGEVFLEDDELFLKCRYEGSDISCPRCDESIAISDEIQCLAVMLSTGELWDFEPYSKVTKVECEVVEI